MTDDSEAKKEDERPARPRPRVAGRLLLRGAALGGLAGLLIRDLDLPALISFAYPREPIVVLAALIGAAIGATRFRWVLGAGVGALALLWVCVAFTPLCGWLASGLARHEAVEPADAVFVSFASLRPDAQRAAEVRTRILHGVALVSRGKAERLVVTETPDFPGVELARSILASVGSHAELVVAGRAGNTRGEAVAVAELCEREGWKVVLVVTSPMHSRRSSAALEKEGLTVVSSPSEEARFDTQLSTWSDRLAAFGSVMHERLGFWVYARRGWIDA
jgi:uncharacterized SAM-binding protein YcdF (DUF218 family)